jgi:hypothetical protein
MIENTVQLSMAWYFIPVLELFFLFSETPRNLVFCWRYNQF